TSSGPPRAGAPGWPLTTRASCRRIRLTTRMPARRVDSRSETRVCRGPSPARARPRAWPGARRSTGSLRVSWGRRSQSRLQRCFHEWIEVPVEHLVSVADLDVGPQILDARLVEHVRTDLIAPAD